MVSSGVNLVMTVIGFAVSTMFIVFVCTRLVCARIQPNASQISSFPMTRSAVVSSNFPTHKYSEDVFKAQYTVCLDQYQPEDRLRRIPYCGHFFHVTCIDIWLLHHPTCPICRLSLRDVPDKKRSMQPMFSSVVKTHHNSYTTEYLALQSYHCLLITAHAYSYGHTQNTHSQRRGMDPIQEDCCAAIETRASPQVMDSNFGNKHVESPSNQ